MISKYIDLIYYLIITILAIKSILYTRRIGFIVQNFLGLYIIVTAVLEIYCLIAFKVDNDIAVGFLYNIYCLFCIIFFWYYYQRVYTKKLIHVSNVILVLSLIFYFFFTTFYNRHFDIKIGILISFYYVFYSLLWFYHKISNIKEMKITDDPYFWVSSALLMWSCFFIFRSIPMFFFNTEDKQFLQILKTIMNLVNILMYIMFYVAILKIKRNIQKYE